MGVIQDVKKNRAFLTRTPVIALLAFICCFLWGSATPVIKTGYSLLAIDAADMPSQILFAGLRLFTAGVMVVILRSFINRSFTLPRGSFLKHVTVLSVIQTVLQYSAFYIGLAHASGVHGAICTATNVFFSILAASLLFHYEKFDTRKLIGCITGFAGVVLINVSGGKGGGGVSFLGEGFVILSQICYGLGSSLVKRYSKQDDAVLLCGWQFLIGGAVLAAAGYILGGRVTISSGKGFLLLTYLAFISAASYSIWNLLLKNNPVSKVSIFGFLNPLCGVVLSALILGEQDQVFTLTGLVSLVLVCLGILIVNIKKAES